MCPSRTGLFETSRFKGRQIAWRLAPSERQAGPDRSFRTGRTGTRPEGSTSEDRNIRPERDGSHEGVDKWGVAIVILWKI